MLSSSWLAVFRYPAMTSSVMHLNQRTRQWLISILPLKMKLITVTLLWESLEVPQSRP